MVISLKSLRNALVLNYSDTKIEAWAFNKRNYEKFL